MSKPALGRGLSALLGGAPSGTRPAAPGTESRPAAGGAVPSAPEPKPTLVAGESDGPRVERVSLDRVVASTLQPRKEFLDDSLKELADSIREQGILQPLVVRRQGERLELIAGERRLRAARLAGLTEVPVIVREADDTTALELMLVENLQREGLNPMDEAQGYAELIERFRLTQEAVATKVGKSRASVANALRLLKLPAEIQDWLRQGTLTSGHGKVMLGLGSPELQSLAAKKAVGEGLSVRQTEELVARLAAPPLASSVVGASPSGPISAATRDPHVVAVEDRLRQRLGTKVSVRYRQGKGQIDIRFFSDDELERVLDIIGVRLD
ncbi:MAG: ParB/RepB/Spo0J family partition protein [Verrucomicrobiales bacterium]|nr:ParB/RepB/Spo0J family partition protein [Verrucomicrobiales bacterium]